MVKGERFGIIENVRSWRVMEGRRLLGEIIGAQ
jgi:hypothetical protein